MPVPKNRSSSVRRIKYKSPTGESRIRFRRRTKGNAHFCAISGEKLSGVNSLRSRAKSSKTVSRPFGGRLSPSISRKVLKLRSRLATGEISIDDVPVALLPYMLVAKK